MRNRSDLGTSAVAKIDFIVLTIIKLWFLIYDIK